MCRKDEVIDYMKRKVIRIMTSNRLSKEKSHLERMETIELIQDMDNQAQILETIKARQKKILTKTVKVRFSINEISQNPTVSEDFTNN